MNKEMYLTEHLVLPSEATLSQTSEQDGVRKLSIHLRRGLALGSGPDEKVASDFTSVPDPSARRASDFTSVPDPSARRICGGGRAQCEAFAAEQTNNIEVAPPLTHKARILRALFAF